VDKCQEGGEANGKSECGLAGDVGEGGGEWRMKGMEREGKDGGVNWRQWGGRGRGGEGMARKEGGGEGGDAGP